MPYPIKLSNILVLVIVAGCITINKQLKTGVSQKPERLIPCVKSTISRVKAVDGVTPMDGRNDTILMDPEGALG